MNATHSKRIAEALERIATALEKQNTPAFPTNPSPMPTWPAPYNPGPYVGDVPQQWPTWTTNSTNIPAGTISTSGDVTVQGVGEELDITAGEPVDTRPDIPEFGKPQRFEKPVPERTSTNDAEESR